jgi:hypothetical protein
MVCRRMALVASGPGVGTRGARGGAVMVTVRARGDSRCRFGIGVVTAAATTADGVRVLVRGDRRHGDEFLEGFLVISCSLRSAWIRS